MSETHVWEAYTGFWRDQSHNLAYGSTLTLSVDSARYLISFLTICVTISAGCCWTITAFILHESKVRGETADVLDLQHQVILRNSGSPLGSLKEILYLHLAWRNGPAPKLFKRTLLLGLPPLLIWAAFTVAGVFVGSIATSSGGETRVLLKEQDCGFLTYNPDNASSLAAWFGLTQSDTTDGRSYAANFYANTTASTAVTQFPKSKLAFFPVEQAPCPFQPASRCQENTPVFSLTTPLLDSHIDFGINAPEDERLQFQKTTTCAIINPVFQGSNGILNFNLGRATAFNASMGDLTYSYNTDLRTYNLDWFLNAYYSQANGQRNFYPIQSLNRTDADVSLFLLIQNSITYTLPVLDPFFLANGSARTDDGLYIPTNLINSMACIDQHRMCDPGTNNCTDFLGIAQLNQPGLADTFNTNNPQRATARRLIDAALRAATYQSAVFLGPSALLAKSGIVGFQRNPVPDDQWQIEVTRWFETGLAVMQANVINFPSYVDSGSGFLGFSKAQDTVDSPLGYRDALVSQCSRQLIGSTGKVQNFSVLGMFIVIAMTIVLVIVSLTLGKIVMMLRSGPSTDKAIARQSDDKMHLLRLALSHSGEEKANWQLSKMDLPTTTKDMEMRRPIMQYNGLSSY